MDGHSGPAVVLTKVQDEGDEPFEPPPVPSALRWRRVRRVVSRLAAYISVCPRREDNSHHLCFYRKLGGAFCVVELCSLE